MKRRQVLLTALLGLALVPLTAPVPHGPTATAVEADRPSTGKSALGVGASAGPVGWASAGGGTTGGAGAPAGGVRAVGSRAELKAALANDGRPTDPKVIYVRGTINGNQTDDGRLLTDQDYAPGWDINQYLACFIDGREWSDSAHPWCAETRRQRTTGSNNEKAQIQLTIPSNTTLVGIGRDARLLGVYLSINTGTNIILRNLYIEAPVDYFPAWSPDDGTGAWNARFDGLSIVTGRNIWVDHCTFSDGAHPTSAEPVGPNGKRIERHDGLLDMEDGTDYVTVSGSQFMDHEKTLLIGSGDSRGDRDRGHLRITFHDNLFVNTSQRSPRVRFGEVHVFNNYYLGSSADPDYPLVSEDLGGPSYFLGMGIESKIFSEYNAFDYLGRETSADIVVANYNGYQFFDRGSWYNGRRAGVIDIARRKFEQDRARALADAAANGTAPPEWATEEFTTDVGWNPADEYRYAALTSAIAVRLNVLLHSGSRVLNIPPPARPGVSPLGPVPAGPVRLPAR